MKTLEQHVWAMMQKVLDTHGPEIARKEGPGVYNPSPAYRGVLVYIDSDSQLSCFCASGKWEAMFKDDVVGVPRKIKDYGDAAAEQSRLARSGHITRDRGGDYGTISEHDLPE